jgi:hypothetical protein
VRNPPPNYQPRWALLAAARRIDAANAHNNDFGGGADLPFDGPEMLASDSDYNRNAGYLEEQAAFQQNDLCDGELLQFTNVSLGNLLGAWSIYCAAIFGRSDERSDSSRQQHQLVCHHHHIIISKLHL